MADRGAIATSGESLGPAGARVAGTGFAAAASTIYQLTGAAGSSPPYPVVSLTLTGSAGSVTVAGTGNSVVVH